MRMLMHIHRSSKRVRAGESYRARACVRTRSDRVTNLVSLVIHTINLPSDSGTQTAVRSSEPPRVRRRRVGANTGAMSAAGAASSAVAAENGAGEAAAFGALTRRGRRARRRRVHRRRLSARRGPRQRRGGTSSSRVGCRRWGASAWQRRGRPRLKGHRCDRRGASARQRRGRPRQQGYGCDRRGPGVRRRGGSRRRDVRYSREQGKSRQGGSGPRT